MTTETTETETTETLPPNTVREKTQASYKFTNDELAALGIRLSHTRRDYSRIEAELKSIAQDYKGKLSTVELEQDALCRKLDDGFEMRDAAALVTFNDPTSGRKTYRHEGSGEFIKEEAMQYADYQLPMFRTQDGKDATEPEPTPESTILAQHEADFENTHDGEGTKEDLGRIEDVPGAGQTNLGEALNSAAVKTEQPQMVIGGFGLDDWNQKGLTKAFVSSATQAGWSKPAISAMRAQILALDNVAAIKDLLRPFVLVEGPSFEKLMTEAMDNFADTGKMKALFSQVVTLYPSKYPGGNHEANFERFERDVAAAIEKDIAESPTEQK